MRETCKAKFQKRQLYGLASLEDKGSSLARVLLDKRVERVHRRARNEEIELSIIIPAYNEEKIIGRTIERLYPTLKKLNKKFEIIIGNDGSSDSTEDLVKDKMSKYKELIIVRNKINQGRGSILSKSFKLAKGKTQAYLDADLSVGLPLLSKFLAAIDEGADVVIASKYMKGFSVEYPLIRIFLGRVYRTLANILFFSSISDYQCGFKLFKRGIIKDLCERATNMGWSWDIDILLRAHQRGYKVVELPAEFLSVCERPSKVRLVNDVLKMGLHLVRLWIKYWTRTL